MPRAEKYYHTSQHLPLVASSTASSSLAAGPRKKHVCSLCERAFTTSGHLSRHLRVHTGERNHKCPFPGCETRCSRQDNLQQHYRIHMSPGSRRSSARSTAARKRAAAAAASTSTSTTPVASAEPAGSSSPPLLEQSRGPLAHTPPPDSPPPLTHATLPATATLPVPACSGRLSSPSSDESYSPGSNHMVPQHTQTVSAPAGLNYSYRTIHPPYQQTSQSSNNSYPYAHPTSISCASQQTCTGSFTSYTSSPSSFANHSQQNLANSRLPAPSNMGSSRLSIAHINNPHYPPSQPPSTCPSSPSVSSLGSVPSAPPTPSYHQVSYDSHPYPHHQHGLVSHTHSTIHNHVHAQPHLTLQGSYPSSGAGRFNHSPPPILAPIQDERYIRRQEPRTIQVSSHYIHQPQPLSQYSYHQSMALGHGSWKTDSIRRGVGAAVV